MREKFKLNHETYVAMSREMMSITDSILKEVVSKTEQAATEIGEKIQSLSSLSGDQAKEVKELLSSIYSEGSAENTEVSDLSKETNDVVDQIMESAIAGDMDSANKLGSSDHYVQLGKKTSSLSKKLEHLSESDKELASVIGPVIMALQFQDSVRQSLENLLRCYELIRQESQGMSEAKLPPLYAGIFWAKIENLFTSTKERNMVRSAIYGDKAKLIKDVSDEDPFLF